MKHRTALLVPDLHAPYHSKSAWKLVCKVGQLIQPDVVVDLGDLIDNYAVSDHLKEVDRPPTLDQEIESANACLDDMDAWRAKTSIFIEGNHETRLKRHLLKHSPALSNLVKIEKLLRLRERGWSFHPYGTHAKVGKMHFTHCINGRAGPQAHRQALATYQHNVAIGHTHRMSTVYGGNALSESHVGAMLGWLGDVEWIDYTHRAEARASWQLGFGVGIIEPNGTFHLQACPIINGKVLVFGSLVS